LSAPAYPPVRHLPDMRAPGDAASTFVNREQKRGAECLKSETLAEVPPSFLLQR